MGFSSSGTIGSGHWSTRTTGQLSSNEDTSARTRCRGEPFARATRLKEPSCSAVTWRLTPNTPGAVDSPLSSVGTGPKPRTDGTSAVGLTDHRRAHGPTAGSATSEYTSSEIKQSSTASTYGCRLQCLLPLVESVGRALSTREWFWLCSESLTSLGRGSDFRANPGQIVATSFCAG
ncbi:hypothetical protein FKM82_025094 [Ascaphus truei]